MTAQQLDLLAPTADPVEVVPTADVVRLGAGAQTVPVHAHVPSPSPRGLDEEEWLGALRVAERCIRWRLWTKPHPLPLDSRPEECVGGGGDYCYDSKGVAVWDRPERRYASWSALLRGLRAQREAEPHIADARDLAAAYHALEQYDRFYVRDGGSVVSGSDPGWRERVAIPWLAQLKATVEKLGGQPNLVLRAA